MFPLCQSKFLCGFAAMREKQHPALASIFVIPELVRDPEKHPQPTFHLPALSSRT